jgi:FkbM family methyltransferase
MTVHDLGQVVLRMKPIDRAAFVECTDCKHGKFIYFPHDHYIGKALNIYGEYIEDELQLLLAYINAGDIVAEVGANIGTHTVPLARAVTEAGRVFAFEPQRIISQMLGGNLAINGIWNVKLERVALGAKQSVMSVPPVDYSQPGNFGSVSLVEGIGQEPVAVMKLDDYQFSRLDLVKIDVEGMELDVLTGAEETLKRLRPILYFENDRNEKQQALCEYVESIGYALYWHTPAMYREANYRGATNNIYASEQGRPICAINMLGLPVEKPFVTPNLKSRKEVNKIVCVNDSFS